MSPNPLYRAAVAELEGVLSPRVVSRSLKEGLAHVGSTPDSIDIEGLERILKGSIYRHLQVAMPVERAKATIGEILERLSHHEGGTRSRSPTPVPLEAQAEAVGELTSALRPFNLYFEWPEVQKLRAQLQLLAKEQEAGREAADLVRDAREGLRVLSQKLEDQLVIQARELGELDALLEQVREIAGVKVRRLEHLLAHISEAQGQRQLATGEVERARKLAAELRKAQESDAVSQFREANSPLRSNRQSQEGAAGDNDAGSEPVSGRLRQIELESDRFELESLETAYAQLLQYQPELRAGLAHLKERLVAGEPLGGRTDELREEFEQAKTRLRITLTGELEAMWNELPSFAEHDDTRELSNALEVALGVLGSSVPELRDVERVRDLHALARERAQEPQGSAAAPADGSSRREAERRRHDELEELRTLELESVRFAGLELDGLEELMGLIEKAREALPTGDAGDDLGRAWFQLETLRSTVEQRLSGMESRLDSALATLSRVGKLNSEDVADARRTLSHLDAQRDSLGRLSLGLRLQLESSLQRAEALLTKLEHEFEATQAIANSLVTGNFIDDMLGILDSPKVEETPAHALVIPEAVDSAGAQEARSDDPGINGWIDGYLLEAGVLAAGLVDRRGTLVAGRLPTGAAEVQPAVQEMMARFGELGSELQRGVPRVATVELGDRALVVGAGPRGHAFLALLDAPVALNRVLQRLRGEFAAISSGR